MALLCRHQCQNSTSRSTVNQSHCTGDSQTHLNVGTQYLNRLPQKQRRHPYSRAFTPCLLSEQYPGSDSLFKVYLLVQWLPDLWFETGIVALQWPVDLLIETSDRLFDTIMVFSKFDLFGELPMFHSNLLNLLAVRRFLPPWKRLERSLSSAIHRTGNSLKVSAAADVNLKPALLSS